MVQMDFQLENTIKTQAASVRMRRKGAGWRLYMLNKRGFVSFVGFVKKIKNGKV